MTWLDVAQQLPTPLAHLLIVALCVWAWRVDRMVQTIAVQQTALATRLDALHDRVDSVVTRISTPQSVRRLG